MQGCVDSMDDTHFRTLGLEPGASLDQIKQAYRDLVRVWHPDRFAHDERLRIIAQEKLKEINAAYEALLAGDFTGVGVTPKRTEEPETSTVREDVTPAPRNSRVWMVVSPLLLIVLLITALMLWNKRNGPPAATTPAVVAVASNAGVPATSAKASATATLVDKTFVAWVTVDNVTQRGGSAFSLWEDTHYDSMDFGQVTVGKWIPGSDWWKRGNYGQDYTVETADPNTVIEIAITYEERKVSLYRNGELLHQYTNGSAPQLFESHSVVVFGKRDLYVNDRFKGKVLEARIYSQSLSPAQIAALKPNEAGSLAPWAWWNFADGEVKDRMGRFPATRAIGGASVVDGKLVLDGKKAYLVAAPTVQQIEAYLPTPITGHSALALNTTWASFSGDTNYAQMQSSGTLAGSFTVEAWVLTKKPATAQCIVGSGENYGFDLQFDKTGIRAEIGNGSNWISAKTAVNFKYLPEKWYHVTCVVTPSRAAIYVDGRLQATQEYPASEPVLFDPTHPLRVGSVDGRSEFLSGCVAELRVWQTARTATEIRGYFNRQLTGSETGLRGYWRFDEGSGTVAADRTGHGAAIELLADADWSTNAPPLIRP